MATRTVSWTSFGRLSCAGCTPADVILCTTFNDATVPAQLISVQRLSTGCGGGYFQYTFSYDTADLPEGVTGLTCANITNAFCKGCLTTWVTQQVTGAQTDLEAQIQAVQTELDEFEETTEAEFTTLTTLINESKTLSFGEITRDAVFNFLPDPNATHDIDLVITNPSATRPLRTDISWGWGFDVASTTAFDPVSMVGQLYVDAVGVTGAVGTAEVRWTPASSFDQGSAGPGGHHHLTVPAGGSVTATLRMSVTVGGTTPDAVLESLNMYVSAFGVTIPA